MWVGEEYFGTSRLLAVDFTGLGLKSNLLTAYLSKVRLALEARKPDKGEEDGELISPCKCSGGQTPGQGRETVLEDLRV